MTNTRLRRSNPFRKTRADSLPELETHSEEPEDAQYEEEEAHAASVREANEWLQKTIRRSDRWTAHLSQIRLECPHTLPELCQFGRLPRAQGVPKCQALVRVPVIYDEIGLFLWTTLAAMDSNPALSNEADEYDRLAAETRQKRCKAILASLDQEFFFDRPVSDSGSVREKKREKKLERKKRDSPLESTKGAMRRSLSSSPPLLKWRTSDSKQQGFPFYRQGSIEEVPEETSSDCDGFRADGSVTSWDSLHRVDSQEGEANFTVRRRSPSSAPSSTRSSIRLSSFGSKISSIVKKLSKTVVTALGEDSSHEQSRRSILLSRGRMKSS